MIFSHYVPIISQKNKQQIHGLFSPTSNEQWPKPWWIMPKPQSVPLKSLKETHFPIAGGCQRRDFILSFIHSFILHSFNQSVIQLCSHSVIQFQTKAFHFCIHLSVVHLVKYYCIHLCNHSFLSTPAFIEWFSHSGNSGSLNLAFSQLFIQSCIHSFIHPLNSFWLVVWNIFYVSIYWE